MKKKKLTASMEDYLEAILLEVEQNQVARVKDVSDRLAVGKSAVSEAIRHLTTRGLVAHESYGWIRLTPDGESFARDVVRRHAALKKFLVEILGMEEAEADRHACIMEHVLPVSVESRLSRFMVFFDQSDCKSAWEAESGFHRSRGRAGGKPPVASRAKKKKAE